MQVSEPDQQADAAVMVVLAWVLVAVLVAFSVTQLQVVHEQLTVHGDSLAVWWVGVELVLLLVVASIPLRSLGRSVRAGSGREALFARCGLLTGMVAAFVAYVIIVTVAAAGCASTC